MPTGRKAQLANFRGMIELGGISPKEIRDGITRDGVALKELYGSQWRDRLPWNVVPMFSSAKQVDAFFKKLQEGDEDAHATLSALHINSEDSEAGGAVDRFLTAQRMLAQGRELAARRILTESTVGVKPMEFLKPLMTSNPKSKTP